MDQRESVETETVEIIGLAQVAERMRKISEVAREALQAFDEIADVLEKAEYLGEEAEGDE